jgi:hypothetical protein
VADETGFADAPHEDGERALHLAEDRLVAPLHRWYGTPE